MLGSGQSKLSGLCFIPSLVMGFPYREGGLPERGLIHKSDDKDIFGTFLVQIPHVLQSQHTILWVKYIDLRKLFFQNL